MRVTSGSRTGVRKKAAMMVAGVMSGTSADGVDVALCRIAAAKGHPRLRVRGHAHTPYPPGLREAVLRAMDSPSIAVADLSRLNWRLGEFYADCVERCAREFTTTADLIGCHGQTIYHQAAPAKYLDGTVRCTWQTGEAALIAERLRCPVVSDFRPADLAAAGQGAPLVPMLDWIMLRSQRVDRLLLNLGGIANLSAIPAASSLDKLVAFDTGPANMVIDGCMRRLFAREFDQGGEIAEAGSVIQPVLESLLRLPYFLAGPPKTCGREQFGHAFVSQLIRRCRRRGATDSDIVATATALSIRSVLDACSRFVLPDMRPGRAEVFLSGGGTRNAALAGSLRSGFQAHGMAPRAIAELGISAEAKEAAAFALLAWLTWHGLPGNVASATGAERPVVLGKISLG